MKKLILLIAAVASIGMAAAEKPNVFFVLLDDVSYHGFSAYGAESMTFGNSKPLPAYPSFHG